MQPLISRTPHPDLPRFKYAPLKDGEFRLLRFLPGNTLSCELFHAVLESIPTYYALSYTWGSAEAYENILVNSTSLPVAYNLWTALHSIGAYIRDQGACIWIDAICIDQGNLLERGAQVLLMTRIYSDATMVTIWLGEHADDSVLAVEKIIEEATLISHISPGDPIFWAESGSKCHTAWKAISKLLNRLWFTRAWIVQEVTQTNERMFCCGDSLIKWAHVAITSFVAYELALYSTTRLNPAFFNSFTALDMFSNWRKSKSRCLLLNLCGELRVYDSTDPRDKIYAIAGFASDISPGDIVPDYSTPFEDIYINFTALSLSKSPQGHELDFLGFVIRSSPDSEILRPIPDNLPSWVPDWRTKLNIYPFHKYQIDIQADRIIGTVYSGSKGTLFSGFVEQKALQVNGLVVDSIKSLSSPSFVRDNSRRETYAILKSSWLPSNSSSLYNPPHPETNEEAFLTTITADTIDASNDIIPIRPHSFDWNAIGIERLTLDNQELSIYASDIIEAMRKATYGRRFMWTEAGKMGLAPAAARVGDRICIFFGGQLLYVLREREGIKWEFVGECYVHGLMDGECLDGDHEYRERVQEFVLI
ncbi:HET-domain-containing protein [Hyaloscypha hepaticicola]|uniref:HET-domain-containing protein n=1 Tax=Hyaloscypha hepaticicola TaxID=2082293 RepID=A0A2J6QR05_9HELO|nr:HET-domain-containing protein [Hyaloscypha hepaticicola]